jgi:hypothetical protein
LTESPNKKEIKLNSAARAKIAVLTSFTKPAQGPVP